MHYSYSDGPSSQVTFSIKDTYDFTKKGHMRGLLQDKSKLATYDVYVVVGAVEIPPCKARTGAVE